MIVATMISTLMMSPLEMREHIASQARKKRLFLNISQKSLAQSSGVSLGSLKKFESTGQISLDSLLKLSIILQAIDGFHELFPEKRLEEYLSIDAILKAENNRQRGRK